MVCKCGGKMHKKEMEYMQKTKKAKTLVWICKGCGKVEPV